MARKPPTDTEALQQRLERLSAALGQAPLTSRPAAGSAPSALKGARGPRSVGRGGLALALALVAVGIATGAPALLVLAAVLGLLSGALMVGGVGEAVLASLPAGLAPRDPTRAHIGVGASVAQDATIEPGATVEMGADVGPGVVVRRGAVVRMGASVHAGAVLEEGAVVGWGADVGEGAVVGRDAVVGAGASVHAHAAVPAGMRLLPGASWARAAEAKRTPAVRTPVVAVDPREARIHAACERVEAELRQAPAQVRDALGVSDRTVRTLRDTCLGLLERERLLRTECSPESLAFLEQERAELDRRIASATDEAVRRSLQLAVEAIEDQKRQRGLLRQSAERLDAELTRLVWTLDGMGAQLVRLRTAGLEAARAPDQDVLRSMQQLHDEIDAIADALEHVARSDDEAAREPLSRVEPVEAELSSAAGRRERA